MAEVGPMAEEMIKLKPLGGKVDFQMLGENVDNGAKAFLPVHARGNFVKYVQSIIGRNRNLNRHRVCFIKTIRNLKPS